MKKILILDDQQVRHDIFIKKFRGHSLTHSFTAKEAIDYLTNNQYDFIFLDHDLGGQTYMASGYGTGYEVAEWISENTEIERSFIVIHSFNPAGASNMYRVLKSKGFKVRIDPFPCKYTGPLPM